MVLSYREFGVKDLSVYKAYLLAACVRDAEVCCAVGGGRCCGGCFSGRRGRGRKSVAGFNGVGGASVHGFPDRHNCRVGRQALFGTTQGASGGFVDAVQAVNRLLSDSGTSVEAVSVSSGDVGNIAGGCSSNVQFGDSGAGEPAGDKRQGVTENRTIDVAVEPGVVIDSSVVASNDVGKHHKRNVAKRNKKKMKKNGELTGVAGSDIGVDQAVGNDHVDKGENFVVSSTESSDVVSSSLSTGASFGYFSECSYEVRKKLKESRASMLVAQNQLRMVEAEEKARILQLEKTTRLAESRFELSRVTVEDKLANISKRRFGTGGSAETVVSSAAPTLLSGSVSPNSSISVAEEMKLRSQLGKALEDLKKLREDIDVKKRTDDLGYDWGRPASPESIYGDDVITGEFVERYTPGIC